MVSPLLIILSLLRLSVGFVVPVLESRDALNIPLHTIFEHLNGSTSVDRTSGTTAATNTKFIMAHANLDTWFSAAVALADTDAHFAEEADPPPTDAKFPIPIPIPKDKFTFKTRCFYGSKEGGVEVTVQDMVLFMNDVQSAIEKDRTTGIWQFAFWHPKKMDLAMWYNVLIIEWDDSFATGLIGQMFWMIMTTHCEPPDIVRGGVESAYINKKSKYGAHVEMYALQS